MTSNHRLSTLSLACTLTFLLAFQFPSANSQEITITEELRDNYYIVKKKPVTLSCAARHAVDISFTCGGAKVPPTSVELEAFSETDPEIIRASISVKREDLISYRKQDKYSCHCEAIGVDGQVAATSKKGFISSAILKYKFKKQPTSQRAFDGESVEFACIPPVSDPKPEIFWKKDKRRINVEADDRLVLTDAGSLLIDSVTGEDAGTYSCVVRNPAGRRESKGADLSVTVLAESTEAETVEWTEDGSSSGAKSREQRQSSEPYFSTEPKVVYYVKPDEELTIDCGVTSANIITFRCNGERVDRKKQKSSQGQDADGNRIIQTRLRVLHSEVMNFHRKNGNKTAYQCQCVGWYQEGSKWRSVLSSKKVGYVKLAYLESTFEKEPNDVIAGVNARAKLTCRPPKGQPNPWIIWYKDGVKIDPRVDDSYRVSREGDLIVVSTQFSDTGRYKCVAENIVKQVETRVAELRITATPPPPTTPTTTLPTTGITIPDNLGDDPAFLQDIPDETPINAQGVAKLTCITLGANMLSIDCNGRRLQQSEFKINRETNEKTGKMMITLTTEVGAGDVRGNPDGYSCRCTAWELNSLGKWERHYGNTGYIVEEQNKFLGEDFVYPPKDTEVYFEDTVEMSCEPPEGNPIPKVYWLKDGNIVKPEEDSNFVVLPAGTLVVEYARAEDEGMYVCVAENEVGTRRSDPAKLTILGTPSTSSCQTEVMKCQGIMAPVVSSRDPAVLCRALDKAKECLMNLDCPELQEELEKTVASFDQYTSMCAGQGTGADCVSELRKCQDIMTRVQSSIEPAVLCPALNEAKECLMGLSCPEEMQSVLKTTMEGLAEATSFCDSQDADCMSGFQKCQDIVARVQSNRDPAVLCPIVAEAKQCLMDLNCQGEMESMLKAAMDGLNQAASFCGMGGEGSAADCASGLRRCQGMMGSIQSNSDPSAMCPAIAKVKKCFMGVKCQGEMESILKAAMDGLEQAASYCNSQAGISTTPSGVYSSTGDFFKSSTMDYESTSFDFTGSTFSGLMEPFFSEEPEPLNYIMRNGNPVTLSCTVIAAKSLMFECNGETLKETATTGFVTQDESGHTIRENSLTITAQQVEAYQGAEPYTCMCKGYAQREDMQEWYSVNSRPAVIQIAFLEYDFVEEPVSQEVMLGEMVIFACSPPKGVPTPTVSWIKDGYVMSGSANTEVMADGSLVIKKMMQEDAGEYTCSAQNMLGQRTSESVTLDVKTSDGVLSTSMPDKTSEGMATAETTPETLRPYKGGAFISKDLHSVYYVTNKKPAKILCEAVGVIDITFHCSSDVQGRVTKMATPKDMLVEDGTMDEVTVIQAILELTKDDVDQYDEYYCKCRAHYETDEEGDEGYKESQEAWVEIAYLKKRFVKEPENVRVKEGNFLTLTCQPPNGNPIPEVSWLKNGESVEKILYPGGTLALEHVSMEDGGEYRCVAENVAARRLSAPFLVEVLAVVGMTTPDGVIGTGGTKMASSTAEPILPEESTFEISTINWKHVTHVDEYKMCQDVNLECSALYSSGETMDPDVLCMGDKNYLSCVNNFLSGCSTVLHEGVVTAARGQYNMVKEMCQKYNLCPQLNTCRHVYKESPKDNDDQGMMSSLHIELFCRDIGNFMQCADQTMSECGVNMADPEADQVSSFDQVSEWFQEYCKRFILEDTSLASCETEVMTNCDLPIDLAAKDNSTYFCKLVDTLHTCTNNSINVCGLTDLQDDLGELTWMKNEMGCGMPMLSPDGGTDGGETNGKGNGMTKGTGQGQGGEASTQASKEDCEGKECGAASLGVSILLITLIQFAFAILMTEQR